MTTLIILIVVFLLLSAFFSGAEIAFISANKLSVEVEKNRGSRKGRILASFYEAPKEFLGTMLVGNNIALVVFTLLMTKLLQPWLAPFVGEAGWFFFVSTMIVTIVVLIFGEFLPKVLFRLYANELISAFVYPLIFFKWILALPSWLMIKMSNFILKYVLRTSLDTTEDAITRLDLQDFIEGTISLEEDEIETDIFKNALHLKEVRVHECMIPRPEITHIDLSESVDALAEVFKEARHSRIIVTEGDIDNVIGYVHHQQLLFNPETILQAMRKIQFVPETMSAKDMMQQMILKESNITCVVDEFGGTAGIITLEDILEEIFGEIEDEHDTEEYIDEQLSPSEYRFSGRIEIDFINEKYENLNIPEGEHNTLSGYIIMTSEDIPDQGEELVMGDYKFIFEAVTEKKIETVTLIDLKAEADQG
ncbi:MAG: HlyC/CorC family transporter [Bacteroidetes bacterium]|nr:MAG: HlyC/CorC family transporter [Bacteroidota bacterium]